MKSLCPLCKSYDAGIVSKNTRDGKGTVLKCRECKHVYLDLGMNKEQLESFLDEFYEQDSQRKAYIDNHVQYIEKIKADNVRRLSCCQKFLKQKQRVLDFGAGYCLFSYLIKPFVSEVTVVDKSKLTRENAEKFELIYTANISDINQLYDIIFSFHSLEHVIDPLDVLKQFVNILQENGLVIIEVPNHRDFLLKASRRYRPFCYQVAHLHYFSLKILIKIAIKAGLTLKEVIPTQRYGLQNHIGWIFNRQFKNKHFLESVYKSVLSRTSWSDTLFCFFEK